MSGALVMDSVSLITGWRNHVAMQLMDRRPRLDDMNAPVAQQAGIARQIMFGDYSGQPAKRHLAKFETRRALSEQLLINSGRA